MNVTRRGAVGGWVLILLVIAGMICGETPAPVGRPLAKATLSPALRAVADRDGINLTTKEAGEGPGLEGDTVVAWIGATHGKHFQQWLIQFKRGTATAAEQRAHRFREVKKYLSWGSIVTFQSEVEALDLWIAGPVEIEPQDSSTPTGLPMIRRTRVFVPGAYLRLGLDQSERVNLQIFRRFANIRKEDPKFTGGHIYSLDKPIKPENIAQAKPVAEKIGFTPEMERAWIGGYVALQSFYDLANDQPSLREIAEIALEKPPVWKLTKLAFGAHFQTNFGGPEARPLDPAAVGLLPVGLESFEVPYSFSLAKNPIVTGWMVVTAPNPPVDVTAGILGMTAVHPKDPTRAVEVMLISSTRAPRSEVPKK